MSRKIKYTLEPSFMLLHKIRIIGGEDPCRICGSPLHSQTSSDGFCGACLKSLEACRKEVAHHRRTCGGIPFYEHNTVPPEKREE